MAIAKQKGGSVRIFIIVLVSLIALFPFLWMIIASFNTEKNIFRLPPQFIPDLLFKENMFQNYITVVKDFDFGRFTLNSIFVSSLASLGQLLVCSLAGFTFALMKFKGKNILFGFLIVTLMVPVQVTIIPEYYIMMRLNWLDTFLPLIVPSFLVGAMGTFMLKEFYEGVPKELFDAGIIDGVNAWSMYMRIYFPKVSQ